MMRWVALLPFVVACASTPEEAANRPLGKTDQAFTSQEAVLLDFELDGHLIAAPTVSDPRPLIVTQLMFMVGQLNGDNAVGRYERLELSNIVVESSVVPNESVVTYHARLPVAWGAAPSIPIPPTYAVTIPARVAEKDQIRFVATYGTTCVDASGTAGGDVDAARMFLFYRPQRTGCTLDPNDVVTSTATVKASLENTTGKYPEYQRIWEDDALDVVAIFSHEEETPSVSDGGVRAHDVFVQKAQDYLRSLQPNEAQRTRTVVVVAPSGPTTTEILPQLKLGATLPDGRVVTINVMLVGYRLLADDPSFDRWYDALTPTADLILYNGHAGLGENVRTLMKKGSFRSRKYVILAVNGCDTFAYLNRSLADRRALLNPDDPLGTKYMDTVSNVMSGYFDTTPAMSLTFIEAMVDAGASKQATERSAVVGAAVTAVGVPKTYQKIFASIDPAQVVVVTGEEDNEFQPTMTTRVDPVPPLGTNGASIALPVLSYPARANDDGARRASCDAGAGGAHVRDRSNAWTPFALLGLAVIARQRRARRRARSSL